jgi:HK97 gp10 family phage protein
VASFVGRLVGSSNVHLNFKKVALAVGPGGLKTAVTAGAVPVQNAWKEKAPVDTGTYRRSVHIGGITQPEEGGDDGHVKQREALPEPELDADHVLVTIGTDIVDPNYPAMLEDGTSRMAAQPSCQPAWDETKDKAEEEIGAVLRIRLEAAGKL